VVMDGAGFPRSWSDFVFDSFFAEFLLIFVLSIFVAKYCV